MLQWLQGWSGCSTVTGLSPATVNVCQFQLWKCLLFWLRLNKEVESVTCSQKDTDSHMEKYAGHLTKKRLYRCIKRSIWTSGPFLQYIHMTYIFFFHHFDWNNPPLSLSDAGSSSADWMRTKWQQLAHVSAELANEMVIFHFTTDLFQHINLWKSNLNRQ